MPKRVVFTRHARERMEDPARGVVTEDEVRAILNDPDVTYTGVDGKPNVLGEANGKRIRVCYVDKPDRITIITVVNRGKDT